MKLHFFARHLCMEGTPYCNFSHLSAKSAGRRQSAPLANFGNDSVDCSKETAVTRRQMRERQQEALRHPFYVMSRWKFQSMTLPPQLTHFRLSHLTAEATLLWISVNASRNSPRSEWMLPKRSSSTRISCSNNKKTSRIPARRCRCCHGTPRASFSDIKSYLVLSQDQLPRGLMGGLGDYRCINHYTDMLAKTRRLRRSLI